MQKNDSNDGLFLVNRGTSDYRLFAKIEAWGKTLETSSAYLPYWPGEKSYCNEIRGTDGMKLPLKNIHLFYNELKYALSTQLPQGTLYPYGIDVNEKIWVYQTDLCR